MMSDSDRSNSISEFCKVTGADAGRAQYYLEAAGWDHNLALASYFEEIEESTESSAAMFPTQESPKPAAAKPKPRVPSSGNSRITTFASLRQNQAADSDEEEGQAFYAGGSERSGQQVLGPSKRKPVNDIVQDMFKAVRHQANNDIVQDMSKAVQHQANTNDIVQDMFKAVRHFGVEEAEHSKRNSSGASKPKAFRGTGYVLGSTPSCSEPVPDEGTDDAPPEALDICLRLWQSGFTVDDGPLRAYDDPENGDFLDTVRRGEIPMELRHKAKGGEVNVKLEDHSHEEFVHKKPAVRPFAGAGLRLGNVTPNVTSPPAEGAQKSAVDPTKVIKVDESKPVTNLQIRLADGSRANMQANHSHTIGDVRRFIVETRPEYETTLFSLLSSFPPKELMDDNATLEDENLINAVVVQKLKK